MTFGKFNPRIHHRRSTRLSGYDYTSPGAYFVTIVTNERREIFGAVVEDEIRLNVAGWIALKEWQKLSARFEDVIADDFVVMPNHVHGIIQICAPRQTSAASRGTTPASGSPAPRLTASSKVNVTASSLGAIVRAYKSAVTASINLIRSTRGAVVWQRNYYEHIIRTEVEWKAIRDYIRFNASQWREDQLHP